MSTRFITEIDAPSKPGGESQSLKGRGERRMRKASSAELQVLTCFVDNPDTWLTGYQLTTLTGLNSGTIYPMLDRLCRRDYLNARKEVEGHLRYTYYQLTERGKEHALREFAREIRAAHPMPVTI